MNYLLHAHTQALLDELRAKTWFSHVGAHEADAIVLDSWEAALERCASTDWANTQMRGANLISNQLIGAGATDRYRQWNDIVAALKAETHPLIDEKCADVVLRVGQPSVLLDSVRWSILHMCVEREYVDVVSPGFFSRQSRWYLAGHFPCGWRGPFPEGGQMVIY